MSGSEVDTARETHLIASEVHRCLFQADMTTAQLSQKIGESQAFIARILKGENHIARYTHILLLKAIANATGYPIVIKISSDFPAKRRRTVKPERE